MPCIDNVSISLITAWHAIIIQPITCYPCFDRFPESQHLAPSSYRDMIFDHTTSASLAIILFAIGVTSSPGNTQSVCMKETLRISDINPQLLALTPSQDTLYLRCAAPPASCEAIIRVVDTASHTITHQIPIGPAGNSNQMEVSPDGRWLYLPVGNICGSNGNSGAPSRIEVIDTATNTATQIPVPGSPYGPQSVVFTPDSAVAYVSHHGANRVHAIDTATQSISTSIQVAGQPLGIAITPDGSRVYTAGRLISSLIEISTATNTITATIPLSIGTSGGHTLVAMDPGGSRAYVYYSSIPTLAIVDTDPSSPTYRSVSTLTLPISRINDLEFNAAGTQLFASSAANRALYVFDVTPGGPMPLVLDCVTPIEDNGSVAPTASKPMSSAYVTGRSATGTGYLGLLRKPGIAHRHLQPGAHGMPPLSNNDQAFAVCHLDDLNGDGVDDIALGSHGDDAGGQNSGAVYILFMNRDGTVANWTKIPTMASAHENFGFAVADLGSLNGTNRVLAVGSQRRDAQGSDDGAVFLLELSSTGTATLLSEISAGTGLGGLGVPNSAPSAPVTGDQFGYSLAALGDRNHDGIPDLAVGGSRHAGGSVHVGAAWVIHLTKSGDVGSSVKITNGQGGLPMTLPPSQFLGTSISALGDLDGDGQDDLAVGAPGDRDGGAQCGAVYVLFLNLDGTVRDTQKISNFHGDFDGVIAPGSNFGSGLDSGDFNGDGVRDLVVGAHADNGAGKARGAVWITLLRASGTVYGHRKIGDAACSSFSGTLLDGMAFGNDIAVMGDLNRDGTTELIIGASGESGIGTGTGCAWVLFMDPTPVTVASYASYGLGCGASNPTLSPMPDQLPWIGETFTTRVSFLSPGDTAFGLLGYSNTQWSGLPLPFDLSFMGMTSCMLHVSPDLPSIPLTKVGSTAYWPLELPCDPEFVGTEFFQQTLVLSPGANSAGAIVSNAARSVVGQR